MSDDPTELEIFTVRWARCASFREIACALGSGRHVEGDEQTTELFPHLARLRSEGDDDEGVTKGSRGGGARPPGSACGGAPHARKQR